MAWRRLLSPLGVLLLWELAARAHWIDVRLIPAPGTIFAELGRLTLSGDLPRALLVSLYRVAAGFAIAAAIGVAIGALMARSAVAETILDPLVELLRPVSPLAIFPLAILWFGIAEASKIFIIALACSFPIILNTYAGVRGIDVALFRAARSLGAGPAEIFRTVVLPGSLPQIFTGLRLAWGIALIVIIAAEMIGATRGIGYMVLEAQQTFRVERVFAGIFVIGALGFVTDLAFRRLQRLLLPWHRETRE
jgi:ABC-type nitrate/sulfonate/bicarbonate transport system permease component